MVEYYENFLFLFTNPEKSFKRFLKDGLKKSFFVSATLLILVVLLQYAVLLITGEAAFLTNIYGLLVLLPAYLLISVGVNFLPIILSAVISSLLAKVFFKGVNNWKRTLILLNYAAIISYVFTLPVQVLYYLPFASVTTWVALMVSLVLVLRASGLAVSHANKVSKFQGLLIYFCVNLIITLALAFFSETLYTMVY
jgi:hypothetical protein